MSFTAHQCVSISCDECGEPLRIFDDYGMAHFTSEAEASKAAVDASWQIQNGRHECESCGDRRRCAEQGHRAATRVVISDDGSSMEQKLSWCGFCYAGLDGDEPELEARIGGV